MKYNVIEMVNSHGGYIDSKSYDHTTGETE